jgi:hypothetical protein
MNPFIVVLLISLVPALVGAIGFNVAAKIHDSHADDTGKLHRHA